MIVTKTINIDKDIDIDVHIDMKDITHVINEGHDSSKNAMQLLNNCACAIRSISDDIINEMNHAQRMIIRSFLEEQSKRF